MDRINGLRKQMPSTTDAPAKNRANKFVSIRPTIHRARSDCLAHVTSFATSEAGNFVRSGIGKCRTYFPRDPIAHQKPELMYSRVTHRQRHCLDRPGSPVNLTFRNVELQGSLFKDPRASHYNNELSGLIEGEGPAPPKVLGGNLWAIVCLPRPMPE